MHYIYITLSLTLPYIKHTGTDAHLCLVCILYIYIYICGWEGCLWSLIPSETREFSALAGLGWLVYGMLMRTPPPPKQKQITCALRNKPVKTRTPYMHSRIHICTCATIVHAHAHTHTHMCTYTHACAHAHTHIHTSLTCDDLSPVFLLVRGKCRGVGCNSDQSIQHQRVYRGPVMEIDGGKSALWRRGFSLTDS